MDKDGRIGGTRDPSASKNRIERNRARPTDAGHAQPPISAERRLFLDWAEAAIRIRDARERILGGQGQFADPAWDLLLDLYVATVQGRPLAVGDACIGARVPQTTALRWLDHLEKLGAVRRSADPRDRRRTLVSLTEAQMSAMDLFFRAVVDTVPAV